MSVLDRFRTRYVKMPYPVRHGLSHALKFVPLRHRFGKTYFRYRHAIEQARYDGDFVANWRRDRLRALLVDAIRLSPHYRRVMLEAGFGPMEAATFEVADLAELPILTKDTLRANTAALLTRPPRALDAVSTSGSSGTPISFYLDKDRSAKELAFLHDASAKCGYSPNLKRAQFRGFGSRAAEVKTWEYEPALRELRFSPFHLTERGMELYCDLIRRYEVRFLYGFPSALYIFSNHVLRKGRRDISDLIVGVTCVSEPLYAHQRQCIVDAYPDARVISLYGLSEKVLFGSEKPDAAGVFELDPIYGVAELLDQRGRPVTEPGRTGRLVGTGLLFGGMPFIRYDTGDVAELVEPASARNLFRMKVTRITPRRDQGFLVGQHGELISATSLGIHSAAYGKIVSYQFRQSVPGKVTIKALMPGGCTADDARPFADELSTRVGSGLRFDIEIVDGFPKTSNGKTKLIDQELELSRYIPT